MSVHRLVNIFEKGSGVGGGGGADRHLTRLVEMAFLRDRVSPTALQITLK